MQGAKLRLQGADPAVELAGGEGVREGGTKVSDDEAEEVPLATKAGHWERMASVRTSLGESTGGCPGLRRDAARFSCHHSSAST
jgi:hypothetical protein